MTTKLTPIDDGMETEDIASYADKSYLNYSMYVIMSRSLPHIGDGLKPVQRRILHAMNELHLDQQAKYKKSARTVGDTLGKYHPHGDSACYEAMVLLAQPFSTRYPLIDGQGNWGSIDEPKSFAAMRYTESKMTSYASSLLSEIKQDTVDWRANFDGTMKEPCLLPAQLPNILLNGVTGIAVGMATDIPPHNMEEIVNACVDTLKRARISNDEILSHITVPDFPTGGEVISPLEDVRDAYRKGRGKIKVRATVEYEKNAVYITSVPYRKAVYKLLNEIDTQVKSKKIPYFDMADLSDENTPVRIKLEIKGREKQDLILNHLFATTGLEVTEKVNLNMIGIDGRPQVKPLPEVIREWCVFRQDVFERKKRFRLKAVEARLHLLDGFIIAYGNLDEVIRIIREEDEPKSALMKQFELSETQAKAILEIRLRQLGKLEEGTLREEQKTLSQERGQLVALLADDKKIKRAVISELKASAKPFYSDRRTSHHVREDAQTISKEASIPKDDTSVVMSKNHWIRGVKGHGIDLAKLLFKTGDNYLVHIETKANLPVIFMGNQGRFFALPTHLLPNGKSMGEPISAKITLQDGERLCAMLPYSEGANVLLTTAKGNGFLTPMNSLDTRAKKGKNVLVVTENDRVLTPQVLSSNMKDQELALLTKAGRLVVLPLDSLNVSNKSQGTRLLDIKAKEFLSGDDELVSVVPLSKTDTLTVMVGKKKLLINSEKREYYRAARARRGVFFEGGRKNLSIHK